MGNTITQKFRDKTFEITVLPGTMHPGFATHTFDTEEQDFREDYWNIKAGDVVFDVGAAYGSYTLAALVSGASKVFAFEPEEKIYPNLFENVRINNWNNRCEVLPYGLWDKNENIDIKSYAPHYESQLTTPTYSMRMLDDCITQFNITKLDWLKVDVEGAEEEVIKGALATISKFKPNIIVECHTFIRANIVENVVALLSSAADYDFEIVNRPPCVMVCARAK